MNQEQIFDITSTLFKLSPLFYIVAVLVVIIAANHYFTMMSGTTCEVVGPLMWVGFAVFLVILGTP